MICQWHLDIMHRSVSYTHLILVDDGSTDQSGNICDEYAEMDSRIKVIHKKNGGVSSARNTGIETVSYTHLDVYKRQFPGRL